MKHDIIFIADEPWEGSVWRRRHHVAWRLADKHRVFFIEPPKPNNRGMVRVKQQKENLYTVSLGKLFPDAIIREKMNISWLNQLVTRRMLRDSLRSFNLNCPILWVYFSAFQYDYYGLFNERLVVADWYDKFTAPTWIDVPCGYIRDIERREKKIIDNADLIFAVSKLLKSDLDRAHNSVWHAPNGVDMRGFEQVCSADNSGYFDGVNRPIIGFLGMMHYIVDFEWLNYLAESRPDWTLVLLGKKNIKVKSDVMLFDKLVERKNVIYVDAVAKELIPGYLSAFDVCVAPMKRLEMNKYADPLKIWEYLAAGKPVIAADQGASADFDDWVVNSRTKEDFVGDIEETLAKEEGNPSSEKRKQFASMNSWDKRVEQMLQIIETRPTKTI